jgi:muramoyltetrapeptide carboxypeptidase
MKPAPQPVPGTIDRYLTKLRQMGVFDRIAGLVVGRFPPEVFSPEDPLEELLLTVTRGYDFPIGIDFDFGHWDPIFVLPNGVQAELTVGDGAPTLALLEPAVQ